MQAIKWNIGEASKWMYGKGQKPAKEALKMRN